MTLGSKTRLVWKQKWNEHSEKSQILLVVIDFLIGLCIICLTFKKIRCYYALKIIPSIVRQSIAVNVS